jgi:hypothetical protein
MKNIPSVSTRYWLSVFTGLIILAVPTVLLISGVYKKTGGEFSYPLDDTFIHMAIAKNLTESGVWGIHAEAFGSASSSLFYTLILWFSFSVFGIQETIPLLLNVLAGALIILVMASIMGRAGVKFLRQFIIYSAVVLLTPLPNMIVLGMEHTFHCLFILLFFNQVYVLYGGTDGDALSQSSNGFSSQKFGLLWMSFYGALIVMVRYEGLFLVLIAVLLLLCSKRWLASFAVLLAALLPLLLFGFYSISKGSYFFPNSVLIKAESVPFSIGSLLGSIQNILVEKFLLARAGAAPLALQRILLIGLLLYFYFRYQRQPLHPRSVLLTMVILLTSAHLGLASTGWFYRYEAYLIFAGVFYYLLMSDRVGIPTLGSPKLISVSVFAVLCFTLLAPILLRSVTAFSKATDSSKNIYDQQVQMGRFLQQYYNNEKIAANDIGAVSFYTKGEKLDLWGLGDITIARSRKGGYWTPDFIDSVARARDIKIAVVYNSWFPEELIKKWHPAGSWTIQNNVICGDSIVHFYAIDSTFLTTLKDNLNKFSKSLPQDVEASIVP